jgi:hypothetical protein
MTGRRYDAVAGAILVLLAVALTWAPWRSGPPQWKPDALFYQAQVEEVRGLDHASALRKVFDGPLAAPRRASEAGLPAADRKLTSPEWVSYSSQFYRRRWTVPVAAAGLAPLIGQRALPSVSLSAYALAGLLVFLLLRLRFDRRISFAAAALVLLLPAFRYWSAQPLSDSGGVAALTAAMISAVLVLDRGRRWLALWFLAVVALAFTRDATLIVVAATAWVALRSRSSEALWLVAVGLLAAVPPFLAFGAPLREALAYTLGGFRVPHDVSWSGIAADYPAALKSLVRNDLDYLTAHPGTLALVVLGVAGLVLGRMRNDSYVTLARATFVCATGYVLLLPNYTAMRLELVFAPPLAVGLACLAAASAERLRRPEAVRANVNSS